MTAKRSALTFPKQRLLLRETVFPSQTASLGLGKASQSLPRSNGGYLHWWFSKLTDTQLHTDVHVRW